MLFDNYTYVSGTSRTLSRYFDYFVRMVSLDFSNLEKKSVLDIASNDGTLLTYFHKYGWNIQGIDPAKNLEKFSKKNNVPTIVDYFSLSKANYLIKLFILL